ncbi:cation diffusion facilitator family transporter [candidate division KSB1 bacterium]|nr:cation diffusion facilitator family transporter [candidate division KSB1 bacterium]
MTTRTKNPIKDSKGRNRRSIAETVVNVGLFFNIVLAIAKISAGIAGHSNALLADGINSVSDVIYFIVVKIFVRLSSKPADSEHPYGHHQLESIAALVVGAFVITTGMAIFWESINTAFDLLMGTIQPRPVRLFTLSVALMTIIAKVFLMLHAGRMGKKPETWQSRLWPKITETTFLPRLVPLPVSFSVY